MAGHVTPAGVFVEVGAARLPLPATAQTVREWVEQAAAAGELTPCPHCGEWFGCDCVDWLEYMLLADRRPLDELTDEDIPL